MSIDKIVDKLYFRSLKVEPLVTNFLISLETSDCKLVGLDNRVKSKDSLKRKVKSLLNEEINIDDISKRIKDSLRYTFEIDINKYSNVVKLILDNLSNNGYKVIVFNNYWGNPEYQGINVNVITPYNLKIEIQFHTKESYYTKEYINHSFYEIQRDLMSTDKMIKYATKEMIKYQKKINIPSGLENINNY